jgi:hypothetical protein
VWAKVGSVEEGSTAKGTEGSRAEETAATAGWAETAREPEVESREVRAAAPAVAVLEALAEAVSEAGWEAVSEAGWEAEAETEASPSKRPCPSR